MNHKKLALIHMIKKELKLSDTQYRDILERITGFRSSKNLDDLAFEKLMKFFLKSEHDKKLENSITFKQKMYIKYLENDLDWDNSHLENFLKKYYHKEKLENFSKEEAIKLIVALTKIKENKKN